MKRVARLFTGNRSPLRKIALAVVVGVGLYACIGFLIAPLVLKPLLISLIQDHLGRKATVEKIRLNPFALSLSVQEFTMTDPDGEVFVGFGKLYGNVQLSSLVRRVYTFHTIRLSKPTGYIKIRSDGSLNFSDLLSPSATPPEPSGESNNLPAVIIYHLDIEEGFLGFSDQSHPTPITSVFSPISITLKDFSTSKESESPYALNASTEQGETFHGEGNIFVNPFRSSGKITLKGIRARGLWEYIQDDVRFEIKDGKIALTSHYEIDGAGEHVLVRLSETNLDVTTFELTEKNTGTALIAAPVFSIHGADLDVFGKELSVKKIVTRDGSIAGWITPEGTFNYQDLFTAAPSAVEDEEAAVVPEEEPREEKPWRILVESVAMENFSGMLENRTLDERVRLDFSAIQVTGKNVSNEKDSMTDGTVSFQVGDRGAIEVEGTVGIDPVVARARVKVSGLDLIPVKSYLASVTNLQLIRGVARLEGTVTYREPAAEGSQLRYEGNIGIDDFSVNDTTAGSRELLSWKGLSCNDLTLDVNPNSLHIADVVFQGPYARVIVNPDMTVNISKAFSPPDSRKSDDEVYVIDRQKEKVEEHGPMLVAIDAVHVKDGTMNFSDQSLTPNFSANIHQLQGSIKGLSSRPSKRAEVLFEGRVDKHAPVKFVGQVNLLSPAAYADLALSFKNVELTTLTPYSGKFAGYVIKKGKLSLDLKYKLEDNLLMGKNTVVLDQLTLGDHVDSPDATTLPVRLAMALLKDRHGRIDLDLPVRGDLNDPEFSYGRIIGKALVKLITKIVASPFSSLAKLTGLKAESLSVVLYPCGTSTLEPEQMKNLDALAQALVERPALRLEIKGTAHKECDEQALAEQMLLDALKRAKQKEQGTKGEHSQLSTAETPLSDEEYNRLILETYKATFGKKPALLLNTSDKEVLPEDVVIAARKRLIETMTVDESSLRRLARDRAQSVQDYLVEEGAIPPESLFLVDVALIDDTGQGTVGTALALTGN